MDREPREPSSDRQITNAVKAVDMVSSTKMVSVQDIK